MRLLTARDWITCVAIGLAIGWCPALQWNMTLPCMIFTIILGFAGSAYVLIALNERDRQEFLKKQKRNSDGLEKSR